MRARAIVLPLPARAGATVFSKTVETVLAERPCRVDHPGRSRHGPRAEEPSPPAYPRSIDATMPAPRELQRGATQVCSRSRWSSSGSCSWSRRSRAAAARSLSACCSASCSSPPAPGGSGSRAGARLDVPPRPRAARALRDRLHVGRQRDLLLARRHRRRARSGLTPVVFLVAGVFFALAAMTYVEGASLHQERGGVDGLRPLRLQRARQLHRRLGDPARLHHPDRGHGVLGDELPGGVLGRRWASGTPSWCCASRSSPTSRCATSAASPRRA